MAIKMDMNKAYDQLEWNFLKKVLELFGFWPQFVKMIMTCISTVSYAILLNGRPLKKFMPSKGIRQGDPMSPYRFLLCNEILLRLIFREQSLGNIHGSRLARNAPEGPQRSCGRTLGVRVYIRFVETLGDLDAVIRTFWWLGSLDNRRFLATKSWDAICQSKQRGGLGFRRLEDVNLAFLSKLAWLMATKVDRPWFYALKGKYFPRDSF
uniref:Reverse transcriptase domain-containing protein n=1 Tax=Cannabis sativa TaxID=3483 RepID=A0A803P2T9_CANSA